MKFALLFVLSSCFVGGAAFIETSHIYKMEDSSWTCPICGQTFDRIVVHDCIPG